LRLPDRTGSGDERGSARPAAHSPRASLRRWRANCADVYRGTVASWALAPFASMFSPTPASFLQLPLCHRPWRKRVSWAYSRRFSDVGMRRRRHHRRGDCARSFVVGIDRYLPKAFGTIHPRWDAPPSYFIMCRRFASGRSLFAQSISETRAGHIKAGRTSPSFFYFIPFSVHVAAR